MLKYDSVHGIFDHEVKGCNDCKAIFVDGKEIKAFAEKASFCVLHISVELIPSCRGIAYRNRHDRRCIQHIVEIVTSVCSAAYIRRIQALVTVFIARILHSGLDHSLIVPVLQIINRRRIADIVIEAVGMPVEAVV